MENKVINNIPVKLSVVLGETEMTIDELSKVAENSEIILNRGVDEMVEIFANHVPIASGEIITLQGIFGVKIKEVYTSEKQKERMSKGNKIAFTSLKIIEK